MKLFFKDRVQKQLSKFPPKDRKKIEKKLLSLENQPLAGKELQGEFTGLRCLRAWPLRIIYTFDPTSQTIEIITLDCRGQVYK